VTLRVQPDVPNLRTSSLAPLIVNAIRESQSESFRVIHFSIQHDPLHLIVEADGKAALANGMHALERRLARRINLQLGRGGPLFGDRYHGRALKTPTEVRNAVRYVLLNWEHHEGAEGVDPYSSAHLELRPVVAEARTWLGAVGWRRS
jgi:REP element-mobilizing transposase RayT